MLQRFSGLQARGAMEKQFFEAAAAGDVDALKRLLDAGMDVNAMTMPGSNGRTALMISAESGHAVAVLLLIEKGADVDYRYGRSGYADYYDEDSALIYAARAGHAEIVRILVDAGADVNAKGSFDGTALISAATAGSTEVVRVLLELGADPKDRKSVV